jgi:hypothetical protein
MPLIIGAYVCVLFQSHGVWLRPSLRRMPPRTHLSLGAYMYVPLGRMHPPSAVRGRFAIRALHAHPFNLCAPL